MKLSKLVFKNARAFRAKSMTIYRLTLLLGGLVAFLLTLGAVSTQSSGVLASSTALRTIVLQSNGNSGENITSPILNEVSKLAGVQSVYPVISTQAATKTSSVVFVMYPTSQVPMLDPPIIKAIRKQVFPLRRGEIVLPSFAPSAPESSLLALVGTTIPVSVVRQVEPGVGNPVTKSMKVIGIYNGSWQLAGHEAAFVSAPTALRWAALASGMSAQRLLVTQGYNSTYLVAKTVGDVNALLGDLGQKGLYATALTGSQANEPGVLRLANFLGKALAVVLAVVLFAATMALLGTQLRSRTRELSTLRALGYSASDLSRMLMGEFVIRGIECTGLATISGMVATVFGNLIVRYLAPSIRSSLPTIAFPSAETVLVVAGIVFAATVLGGLLPLRRSLALEPADGLRDL
nr:FtsX-like permease family protein [Ferrimicrobium acidiphilum]